MGRSGAEAAWCCLINPELVRLAQLDAEGQYRVPANLVVSTPACRRSPCPAASPSAGQRTQPRARNWSTARPAVRCRAVISNGLLDVMRIEPADFQMPRRSSLAAAHAMPGQGCRWSVERLRRRSAQAPLPAAFLRDLTVPCAASDPPTNAGALVPVIWPAFPPCQVAPVEARANDPLPKPTASIEGAPPSPGVIPASRGRLGGQPQTEVPQASLV